ncbi:MAG: hypothetical protein RSC66_02800, partial [Comamonas sp.]
MAPATGVAAAATPGPVVISQASSGVQIIRDGQAMAAQAGSRLQIGDKIIVPPEGSAKAMFSGSEGQQLVGTFAGGTEATLSLRPTDDGAGVMALDLAS